VGGGAGFSGVEELALGLGVGGVGLVVVGGALGARVGVGVGRGVFVGAVVGVGVRLGFGVPVGSGVNPPGMSGDSISVRRSSHVTSVAVPAGVT